MKILQTLNILKMNLLLSIFNKKRSEMRTLISLIVITLSLVACSKNDNRMKEKAAIESESSTASQLRVENENQAKKAEKMELELAKRHRFYQSVKGTYEGEVQTAIGKMKIEITFTPSKAPVTRNRVRQLEEITTEINELKLTAHAIQSAVNIPESAVGCPGVTVADDIMKGELTISSPTCPNLYLIKITEKGITESSVLDSLRAAQVANQIFNGDLVEIDSLSGQLKTSTYASKVKFVIHKVVD